jgi:hypothetical protein
MSSFPGYTRKKINKAEYLIKWKLSLLVVASVSDPSGCISPFSTPGVYRMVTIWGRAANEPLIEANTEGSETTYYKYERTAP